MQKLGLVALLLVPLLGACIRTTHLAADKYDRPIMVGPVRTLGGSADRFSRAGDFALEVDNSAWGSYALGGMGSDSNRRAVLFGAEALDGAATAATESDRNYRLHLDEIRVGAYNFSLLGIFYYKVNSWGHLRGQVVRVPPMIVPPPPAPASAEAPAAVKDPVEEKPPEKPRARPKRGKQGRRPATAWPRDDAR